MGTQLGFNKQRFIRRANISVKAINIAIEEIDIRVGSPGWEDRLRRGNILRLKRNNHKRKAYNLSVGRPKNGYRLGQSVPQHKQRTRA